MVERSGEPHRHCEGTIISDQTEERIEAFAMILLSKGVVSF